MALIDKVPGDLKLYIGGYVTPPLESHRYSDSHAAVDNWLTHMA
jgi:hypothetical protein